MREDGRPCVRVRYRSPGEVLWKLGETLNRGWLLAPLPAAAPVGHAVEVEFKLPGLEATLQTPGEVLDVVTGARGRAALSRVGFAALTEIDKAEIDRLLRSYRRRGAAVRRRKAAALSRPPRALSH